MDAIKHRTQISLEAWQYEALLDLSRKTKKSLSGIIRDLLTEKLSKQKAYADEDPIWGIVGLGEGDGCPVAREHDKFLYERGKRR